jgi:hypothetical protein
MKYRIKIIHLSDPIKEAKVNQILTRVGTGFDHKRYPAFTIIKTDSIAWFATAVELLESNLLAWEATSGC